VSLSVVVIVMSSIVPYPLFRKMLIDLSDRFGMVSLKYLYNSSVVVGGIVSDCDLLARLS